MTLRKHIPNIITSMNLLCGAVGVIFAFADRQDMAFLWMLAAGVFDFCDGLVARALGASSDIGKELDSLCDCVSFGLLPALMLHRTMVSSGIGGVWVYIPLLLAAFSALRLAKFNLDERQHGSFIGLATPPCALICASLCSLVTTHPDSVLAHWCAPCWVLPLLAVVLSALLVSEIPMFAFKFGKGKSTDARTRTLRVIFLAIAVLSIVVTAVFGLGWQTTVLLTFVGYTLINCVAALVR